MFIAVGTATGDEYPRPERNTGPWATIRYHSTGGSATTLGHRRLRSHGPAHPANPASFVWDDLSYEPIPPDAVVVVGKFTVGYPGITSTPSYSALLRRQNRRLRIRVEDESIDPANVPPSWTDSTASR